MATERRAETATDEEERTVMERLVLKAWKGLEVHAKMGQRGASSPMNNMKEWSTDAGWLGGKWRKPHGRQVVFWGEAGVKPDRGEGVEADGNTTKGYDGHRKPSSGMSEKQHEMGQLGIADTAKEAAKRKWLWQEMASGGDKQTIPGYRPGTEFGSDAMRENGVGKMLIRVDLLEDAEGVEMATGIRVRVGADERRAMNDTGLAATKEMGRAMLEVEADNLEFDIIAAVDGSCEGEGDEKRVAYGRWRGPSVRRGVHDVGESVIQGRRRIAEGMMGGRLPGTWDNEDAEVYAILMRYYRNCVMWRRWSSLRYAKCSYCRMRCPCCKP